MATLTRTKPRRAQDGLGLPPPVFTARYRVLVLKNTAPHGSHDKVMAICIEQNLVGRGSRTDEAVHDLADTLTESIAYEWNELLPHTRDDPDPDDVALFESADSGTPEGLPVLARMVMKLAVRARRYSGRSRSRRPDFSFEVEAA